uniref:ARAD1C29040p n=1 Tax=Blastobotrys adeninivorans TaxID=409370 RepID=A0A060T250_BLAAD
MSIRNTESPFKFLLRTKAQDATTDIDTGIDPLEAPSSINDPKSPGTASADQSPTTPFAQNGSSDRASKSILSSSNVDSTGHNGTGGKPELSKEERRGELVNLLKRHLSLFLNDPKAGKLSFFERVSELARKDPACIENGTNLVTSKQMEHQMRGWAQKLVNNSPLQDLSEYDKTFIEVNNKMATHLLTHNRIWHRALDTVLTTEEKDGLVYVTPIPPGDVRARELGTSNVSSPHTPTKNPSVQRSPDTIDKGSSNERIKKRLRRSSENYKHDSATNSPSQGAEQSVASKAIATKHQKTESGNDKSKRPRVSGVKKQVAKSKNSDQASKDLEHNNADKSNGMEFTMDTLSLVSIYKEMNAKDEELRKQREQIRNYEELLREERERHRQEIEQLREQAREIQQMESNRRDNMENLLHQERMKLFELLSGLLKQPSEEGLDKLRSE